MDPEWLALIVFFSLAVPVAVLCHRVIRHYLGATALGTGLSLGLVQAVLFLDSGDLTGGYDRALITYALLALGVSALAGLPLLWRRRR